MLMTRGQAQLLDELHDDGADFDTMRDALVFHSKGLSRGEAVEIVDAYLEEVANG